LISSQVLQGSLDIQDVGRQETDVAKSRRQSVVVEVEDSWMRTVHSRADWDLRRRYCQRRKIDLEDCHSHSGYIVDDC